MTGDIRRGAGPTRPVRRSSLAGEPGHRRS